MEISRRALVSGLLGTQWFPICAQDQKISLPQSKLSFVEVLLQIHQQTGKSLVVEGIPSEKKVQLTSSSLGQVLNELSAEFDFTWQDDTRALVLVQQFKKPENTPELSADEFAASLRDIQKLGIALDAVPAQLSFTRSLQSFVRTLPQPQQALLNSAGLPIQQLSPEHHKQFEALLFQKSFGSILFKARQLEQTLSALPAATLHSGPQGVIWINRELPLSRNAIAPCRGKPLLLASPAWPQESLEQPALITWGRFLQTLSTTEGLRVAPELARHPAFFIAKEPSLSLLRTLAKLNDWQFQRRRGGEKPELLLRRPALPIVTHQTLGRAIFQVLPTSVQRYLSARYPEDTIDPIYPILPRSMGKVMSDLMQKSNNRLQRGYEVVAKALGDKESLRVTDLTSVQKTALADTLIFKELEQIGVDILGKALPLEPTPKPDLSEATLSSSEGGNSFTLRYTDGSVFTVRTGIHIPSPGR